MIPDLSKTLAKATEAPSKKRKLTKVNEEPRSHKSDKVQEQALELLDATVKSVLPPKVNKKYPMKVVTEAYKNFEEAVGGRDALITVLNHVPVESKGYPAVQKLLKDPKFESDALYSLFAVCGRNNIALSSVVTAFRDATMAHLAVESMVQLAEKAPAVVEQIADDAQNRYERCHICEGKKRVKRLNNGEWEKDANGNVLTGLCYECRGTGKIWKVHDTTNRKLFLQITGILDDKRTTPLVNINNNNANVLNGDFLPGDGTFEKLIRAIDLTTAVAAPKEEVIDVPFSVYEEEQAPDSASLQPDTDAGN